MVKGIDTTFLIQVEVACHPAHASSKALLDAMLSRGDSLALSHQVLPEFIHIVTDQRRFSEPLSMPRALKRAEAWWHAKEVLPLVTHEDAPRLFLNWMEQHTLGRNRLLDTMLAATYFCHGVRAIVTSNARDFAVFGCFEVFTPQDAGQTQK